MIDFLAILFGYAISGERTLETFYERLQPFAMPFMAGAGAGSATLPFSARALFRGTHPRAGRSTAHALSRRSAESPTHIPGMRNSRKCSREVALILLKFLYERSVGMDTTALLSIAMGIIGIPRTILAIRQMRDKMKP